MHNAQKTGGKIVITNTELIILLTAILVVIGTVNIFSSSFVRAGDDFDNSYYFLWRHLLCLMIGCGCFLAAMAMDYRKWRGLTIMLLLFTVVTLALVMAVGIEVNGSRRWLNLGIQFQPSEFAKLTALFLAAYHLSPYVDNNKAASIRSKPMAWVLLMGLLVFVQPDMGTAAVIVGLPVLLYFLTGLPRYERNWMCILVVAGTAGLAIIAPYRLARIQAWLDPWAHQQTFGYQTIQSMITVGSGGLFGSGIGMGMSKFDYLPEAHTDFAFAIICQEWGFVGAAVVISLFIAMAVLAGKVANSARDGLGRLLAVGVAILIAGQAFVNIAMVVGAFPVVGVPLPFISYGGTSLIINMTAVGILLSVARRTPRRRSGMPGPNGGERMTLRRERSVGWRKSA